MRARVLPGREQLRAEGVRGVAERDLSARGRVDEHADWHPRDVLVVEDLQPRVQAGGPVVAHVTGGQVGVRAALKRSRFAGDALAVGKTLGHRLDDACERWGLEWIILPFDRSPSSWREGPYWGALVVAQYGRRPGRAARFYRYNEEAHVPSDRRPDPQVVFINLQPVGRHEIKRLLLAQIENDR